MDEIVIDLSRFIKNDRGFEDGDPDCLHQRVDDWNGEDATRELDVCAECGATRIKRM